MPSAGVMITAPKPVAIIMMTCGGGLVRATLWPSMSAMSSSNRKASPMMTGIGFFDAG